MTIITLSELLIFLQMEKVFSVLLSLSKPFDAADIFLTYIFFSFRTSLCWRRLLWGELRWGIFGSGHQKFRTDLVGYVHIFLENSGRRYDFIFFILILLEHDKLLAGISKPYGVWKSQKKSHSTLRAKRDMFTFWVDKSLLKMPNFKNSNATFWIIFKQCANVWDYLLGHKNCYYRIFR